MNHYESVLSVGVGRDRDQMFPSGGHAGGGVWKPSMAKPRLVPAGCNGGLQLDMRDGYHPLLQTGGRAFVQNQTRMILM